VCVACVVGVVCAICAVKNRSNDGVHDDGSVIPLQTADYDDNEDRVDHTYAYQPPDQDDDNVMYVFFVCIVCKVLKFYFSFFLF